MQYKKIIQSELEFTKTFRLIAQSYQEIAVMKMRRVRNSVLSNREYLGRLSEVFYDIKRARNKQLEEARKKLEKHKLSEKVEKIEVKKDAKQPLTLTKERIAKTASVFLSANTSLYGDLIAKIFRLFIEKTSQDQSDIIIVGRVGRRLYEEYEHKRNYFYFELPDLEITLESLKPVIFHLVKYQKILVYFGKFDNIVNQSAEVANASGDQPFLPTNPPIVKEEGMGTDFLFEPSLDTILSFFEDLITSSLFRQTVHETQLARLASRIMSMEKAQQNVSENIKKLRFVETKLRRQDDQKKQINRLSGISLWLK